MSRAAISAQPAAEDAAATRARLVSAAGEVFAEKGFQAATVREICARAGANIAAVNYHFGDKTELYLAVIRESVCSAAEQAWDGGGDAEARLNTLITVMLRRMGAAAEQPAWHFRIMAHEMVAPTPVFARVVDEVIGPQYERLRGIIGGIIGLPQNHGSTRLAANSVVAQALFYAHGRPVIERLWPGFAMDDRTVTRVARHIASFSLCSLRAMRKENRARKGRSR